MKDAAKTFRDLIVWQKAHYLVLSSYQLSREFPKNEQFCLTSQFKRAVTSIAANIVEGFKRKGSADKARFLNIAQGSLEETRYYLILIQDPGYGDTDNLMVLIEEVSKMLNAYIKSILTPDFRLLYS